MPILDNARHERFAQEVARGKSADEAYVLAGYQESRKNASRLRTNEGVAARIEEILAKGAAKVGITVERVLTELAKIGFSDIRKAVNWRGALVREEDQPDGGDVLVIKEIFSNHVRLIDSDKIDDDMAAAIAEVRQSPTGGLSIKLHDKRAALVDIGKHLGMFKERVEHTLVTERSADELRAEILASLAELFPEIPAATLMPALEGVAYTDRTAE